MKTEVQLAITDASNKNKSCQVVCSGAMSINKLGQLIAFLTDHTNDYKYHIQRGKSLKGSYLELSLDCENEKRTTRIMTFDTERKATNKSVSLMWIFDKGDRYTVKAEGGGG